MSPEITPENLECCRTALLGRYHTLQELWQIPETIEAEDVVQRALTKAWESRESFVGRSRGQLFSWLFTILNRVTIDVLRECSAERRMFWKAKSLDQFLDESVSRFEQFLEMSVTSPSEVAQRNELIGQAYSALELLPTDQRAAVIGRYLCGMSLGELVKRFQEISPASEPRTEKAIARLVERGLTKLRDLLRRDV
jgi:RNA polymerase sigma-70 factor (ECF subfamily)